MNDFIPVETEILKEENVSNSFKERVIAAKKEAKDKDLLYIKARYVHEGSNLNNDVFLKKELQERHTTAIYKPMDLDHDPKKIVGTIYDTELVEASKSGNNKLAMNVYGVVYKWLFPEVANLIEEKYASNDLKVSMETWFDKAECSVCGEKFEKEEDYCDHLKRRYSVADNKRIFHGVTFGGLGFVDVAGDDDANVLSLASKADAGTLKNNVMNKQEKTKFEILINEVVNQYYNLIYSEKEQKEKKQSLINLIEEFKNMLSDLNVNKLAKAKGDNNNMADVQYNQEAVDAMIAKAVAEKEEEMQDKFDSEKAEVEEENAEELNTLKEENEELKKEKEELEKENTEMKEEAERIKRVAARKKVLKEKEINLEESEENDKALATMDEDSFNFFVSQQEKTAEQIKQKSKGNLKINDDDDPKDEDKVALEAISNI